MRDVFSDESRTRKYLEIERELARVQGRLGITPVEAAEEIVKHCGLEKVGLVKLNGQKEQIG